MEKEIKPTAAYLEAIERLSRTDSSGSGGSYPICSPGAEMDPSQRDAYFAIISRGTSGTFFEGPVYDYYYLNDHDLDSLV